jgi:60 kDa SS-A/Ro ribonucleoprotein
MSKSYSSFVTTTQNRTPLTQPQPGRESEMVKNHDGAMVFQLDSWKQLDRFLILGAAAPTYYASRKELVKDNVGAIEKCIAEDGVRVVNRLVEISDAGRAPKNAPALFTLALVIVKGNKASRDAAYAAINKVARIGTHIFNFVGFIQDFVKSGQLKWNRATRKAIANWFTNRKAESLAYQVIKYRQRDGWSMEDVTRLSHPKGPTPSHQTILKYLRSGWTEVGPLPHDDKALQPIWAYERAKTMTSAVDIATLVREYGLPWETLDTKWLNYYEVWDALIENIKPEALMRNLSRLTANGFLKPMSKYIQLVVSKLTDQESLVAHRIHPLKVLVALKMYQQGSGDKGSLTWTPIPQIVDALEKMYYLSFKVVVPANKRTLLAIDVSGSMDGSVGYGGYGNIAGMPLSPREGAAAMAMVTARTEPQYHFVGFSHDIVELKLTANMSLAEVVKYMQRVPMGSTNISAPFHWARKNNIEVDTFIVLTDNEVNSYYGNMASHPSEALKQYSYRLYGSGPKGCWND